MPPVQSHDGHIPIHRLWSFVTSQGSLTMGEHAHINDCEECRTALRVCLKSQTFADVLKDLKNSGNDPGSAKDP